MGVCHSHQSAYHMLALHAAACAHLPSTPVSLPALLPVVYRYPGPVWMKTESSPIISIFSFATCNHCKAAKKAFGMMDWTYNEISITDFPERRADVITLVPGSKTLPQIFFGDTHLGGAADL